MFGGLFPVPIPLREVPQVRGVGSDLQTLSIPFPPQAQLGSSWHSWDAPEGSGGLPKGTATPRAALTLRLGGKQGPAGSAIGELSQQSCWTCPLRPNGSR